MTARKPKGKSWESWTEQQIREAQVDGRFDQLAGKGKPLPDLTGVHDPQWWVKKLVRREQLSDLPPAMAIKVRVEHELAQLAHLSTEADVRAKVAALNAEIAKVNRTTISGPPTSLAKLDVDAIVERWRRRNRP
ncbi:MAG TPA: DUF1992 domain-containing protein [Candidatus Binatia bacterium]|nr:DUF1992 domain-containing protein [Candidatus Binatia bacterium]